MLDRVFRWRKHVLSVLLSFAAALAWAQAPPLERILLPVSTPEIPGAFGARFITQHFIRNDAPIPAVISRDDCTELACEITIPANSTRELEVSRRRHLLWISVESARAPQLFLSTMVRDVSKSIEPWGTEIPTVRESEFRIGRVQILNVPTDPAFRLNLRLYAIPAASGQQIQVLVRIFDLDAELTAGPGNERLLAERGYIFQNTPLEQGDDYLIILAMEREFPALSTATRLRVEVQQLGEMQSSLWALLTATNNQTQHITIFNPE